MTLFALIFLGTDLTHYIMPIVHVNGLEIEMGRGFSNVRGNPPRE